MGDAQPGQRGEVIVRRLKKAILATSNEANLELGKNVASFSIDGDVLDVLTLVA